MALPLIAGLFSGDIQKYLPARWPPQTGLFRRVNDETFYPVLLYFFDYSGYVDGMSA